MWIRLIHALLLVLIMAWPALAQDAGSFTDALKLTEMEATALGDVADRSPQLDETAFYMMLAKAASVAERTDQDYSLIDSPAAAQLLAAPQRWRGWPVRVDVRVYRVEKLQGHKHISPSPHWPVNNPLWKLSGTALSDPDIAILAFSVTPPLLLGKPDSITTDATGLEIQTYNNGVPAELIGFSYKIWSTKNIKGHLQDCPIVVAWKIATINSPYEVQPPRSLEKFYRIVALGMALLIGYLFLKVYTRRIRKSGHGPQRTGRIESVDDGTPQIDPLLKAAAEQYAKETQGDGEPEDN